MLSLLTTTSAETPNNPPPAAARSPLRRYGCGLGLAVWLVVLFFLPCLCIMTLVRQEVVIPTGAVPGQELRVWLIMEADLRGLGVASGAPAPERSAQVEGSTQSVCIETYTQFWLWMGQAEPVWACECYSRQEGADSWSLVSVSMGSCEQTGVEAP